MDLYSYIFKVYVILLMVEVGQNQGLLSAVKTRTQVRGTRLLRFVVEVVKSVGDSQMLCVSQPPPLHRDSPSAAEHGKHAQ